MKGMIRQVTVVETARPADVPVGDVTMTLHDYGFALAQPLTAGTRLIEKDGRSHFMHGMVQELEVSSAVSPGE